jgi:RNA polymerase sigma factor (sigma-70 family)
VRLPDLHLLKAGTREEWDFAFEWLWPSVVGVVEMRLGPSYSSEAEDVAIEALEVLIEKVPDVHETEELKFLAMGIARNKAIDFLRSRLAVKHGGGKLRSLEDLQANNPGELAPATTRRPLIELDATEMGKLLKSLLDTLRDQEGHFLEDFFVAGLSYTEIAEKYATPIGSVGVVLSRAIQKLRKALAMNPKLMKELEEYFR